MRSVDRFANAVKTLGVLRTSNNARLNNPSQRLNTRRPIIVVNVPVESVPRSS